MFLKLFEKMSEEDRRKLDDIGERNAKLCKGDCSNCPHATQKDTKCKLLNQAKELQIQLEMNYNIKEDNT